MGRLVECLVLALLLVTAWTQSPEDDEVFVQDLKEYTHRYYSGYLDLNFKEKIHYVMFESQKNPSSDPVLVSLAGGPGCSSLLTLFQQNGPFIFSPGSNELKINPYAWNKRANVLYLEIPVGVGYSESSDKEQKITDQSTAIMGLTALTQFYARFPYLKKNPLYLSGHGYSAVFVAYLSKAIIQQNQDPLQAFSGKINLGGILVGNPCTAPNQCYATGADKQSFFHYQFLYNRAYFSKQDFSNFIAQCAFNYNSFDCFEARSALNTKFKDTNSSIYNIYSKCYKTINSSNVINTGCQDEAAVIAYLNSNGTKINWNLNQEIEWQPCSNSVYLNYFGSNNSYWLYPYLIKNNMRIWVYSGDLDASVPIIGTKRWIQTWKMEFDVPIIKNWREWWVPGIHKLEDQVGGFIWELQGLTFASVRGAGFRAAMDRPLAMEEVLNGFLDGKTLPYKSM